MGRPARRRGLTRRASLRPQAVRSRLRNSKAPAPSSTADDRHLVAELLDLGEDVARQQPRGACRLRCGDALLEHQLHERVQARGRLVQDEGLDVGGQRSDQGDLLPVALGVRAGLLARVEVEPLEKVGLAGLVDAAAEAREQVDRLAAGELGPERDVAGHVGQAMVQADRVGPWVRPEQGDVAPVRLEQTEQDADGGGLPGRVEHPVIGVEALGEGLDRGETVTFDVPADGCGEVGGVVDECPCGLAAGLDRPQGVADDRCELVESGHRGQGRGGSVVRGQGRGLALRDDVQHVPVALGAQPVLGAEVVHDQRRADPCVVVGTSASGPVGPCVMMAA